MKGEQVMKEPEYRMRDLDGLSLFFLPTHLGNKDDLVQDIVQSFHTGGFDQHYFFNERENFTMLCI